MGPLLSPSLSLTLCPVLRIRKHVSRLSPCTRTQSVMDMFGLYSYTLRYSLAYTGRYHQSYKARHNFSDNTSMDYVLSDALKCEKYQIGVWTHNYRQYDRRQMLVLRTVLDCRNSCRVCPALVTILTHIVRNHTVLRTPLESIQSYTHC